jgi:hypothetical protein
MQQHAGDAVRALEGVVRGPALVQEPREQAREGRQVAGEDERLRGEGEEVFGDAVAAQGEFEVVDAARRDEGAGQAV